MADTLDPSLTLHLPSLGPSNTIMDKSSLMMKKQKKKKPYDVSLGMQGFQQKTTLAQTQTTKGICHNGSGQNVGRMSMKEIIGQPQQDCEIPAKFQIPIFQRRYCWTEAQWQTLLMDAATSTSQHSMGRLAFINQPRHPTEEEEKVSCNQRSIILDGQQRFITVTLLLASIRDALWKRQQRMALKGKEQIVETINQILFPDQQDCKNWITSSSELKEGVALPFAKLIPTYCDRWSYYSAILPSHWSIKNRLEAPAQAWHRPLAAKKYFDAMLSTFSNDEIWQLYKGVMEKLTMVLFLVDFRGNIGGSEDLMERLALRDVTFCKSDEYVTMSGLDMIRNALLGAFGEQAQALEFYQSYWLPMERIVASSAAASANEDQQKQEEGFMTSMMNAFLDQEFQSLDMEEEITIEEGTKGGLLYARFQFWQATVAIATKKQGEAILAFAQGYFVA